MGRSTTFLLGQSLAYESAEEIRAAFPDVDVHVVEGCAPAMDPGGDAYTLRCFDPATGERDVLKTRADVLGYLKWHRPQGKQVMTAEDDPAIQAAAVVAPTMSTGSGLDRSVQPTEVDMSVQPTKVDMSVQPTEVEGRAATFRLTYRNHSPASISVALTAQDGEEALRFRYEPAEAVIVPAGSARSVMVHVVPKVREMVGVPHAYAIVFRALQVWPVRESNPDLVREARFTYVPPVLTPVPAMLPAWVRRLPVWTLPLLLVLLVLLLVLAAGRTLASPTTRTAVMRTPAPTRAIGAIGAVQPARPRPTVTGNDVSMPPVQYFDVLLNPNTVRFGGRSADVERATQTVHLVNLGLAPLRIAAVAITGADSRDFAVTSTCTGHTFTIDNGCTIRITFTPTRSGTRHAWLTVKDILGRTVQSVPLSGRG